jgi:virginiamycin B lyase
VKRARFTLLFLLGALLALAAPASAAITEFEIEPGAPAGTHGPRYIHPGPDGNLWYADSGPSAPGIGRISPAGERFATIPDDQKPVDLVTAPDGTVYWTADGGLGLRSPTGAVQRAARYPSYAIALNAAGQLRWGERIFTEGYFAYVCKFTGAFGLGVSCGGHGTDARVTGLTLGKDGRLWAAVYERNQVRRLDADGTTADLAIDLPAGSGPARLALGSDGNLWVTMFDAGAIDRFTTTGVRTRFPLPAGSQPNDITAGPDGALWITEFGTNKVARMTTAGVLTNEYPIPTPASKPIGITGGPDGALWFTESTTGKIGRLTLDPPSTGGGGTGGGGTGGGTGGGKPGGGGTGGGGTGKVSDTFPPRFLNGASFDPARFRVASGSTPVSAKSAPKGSTLAYALSEASTVTILIERKAAGRRSGGSCKAPSTKNKGARPCTRYLTAGTLSRRGLQGGNEIAFTGRIGRRALKPGSYRATVTAKDAAGNKSKTSTAGFTIVAS